MRTNIKKPKDFGTTVFAHNHKSIEEMIRRFKKRVSKLGILNLYREKQEYVKPSVKRRRKKLKQQRYRK